MDMFQDPKAVATCLVISVIVFIFIIIFARPPIRPFGLDGAIFHPFRIIEKRFVNHNTCFFRLALQTPTQSLGLPVGQHVMVNCILNNKPVKRQYTPISLDSHLGYMNLLVKVYRKDDEFPAGGRVSQYLGDLLVGQDILIRGPHGNFFYDGQGNFRIKQKEEVQKKCKRILMIAGGTGITPMYRIMASIDEDPEDNTEVFLFFSNQRENDILLREELEKFANKESFHIWFTLTREEIAPISWPFSMGHINAEMIKDHFSHSLEHDTLALICGPSSMSTAMSTLVEDLGCPPENCLVL